MQRLAALLLPLVLALPARAGEAEQAYARLVRQVAPGCTRARGPDGAIVSTAELKSRAQAAEWLKLLQEFEQSLQRAPEEERPRALDLERHLGELHEALAWAAALAQPSASVVRAKVQLTDDAGGWDSVHFGRNGYPAISGDVQLLFQVPARFFPGKQSVPPERQPLLWACPRASYQVLDPARIAERPAPVERYLADVETFTHDALQLAGRTSPPAQLFVLEPPEVGHQLAAVEADPEPLPLSYRLVPTRQWAGIEPGAGTPLDQLAEARRSYERLLHVDHAREIVANCALVAQRLVLDPLKPAVAQVRAAQRQQLLAPYQHQFALYPVTVRAAPDKDAPGVGTLPRGAEVEVLEGLDVTQDEPPKVVPQPYLRVKVATGPEGWIAARRVLRWQTDGLASEEAQEVLAVDPPPTQRQVEQQLSRLASAWRLAANTAQHFKDVREQESFAESTTQAAGAHATFCKLKAHALAAFGAEWLQRAAKDAVRQRQADGETAPQATSIVRRTYEDPRCGAVDR